MPAIPAVALDVTGVALGAVADTSLGTSAALTDATPYLVLVAANAASEGSSGDAVDGSFLVGGTAYATLASEHATFGPAAALDTPANGGMHALGAAFTHTPASGSEVLDFQAWTSDGTGAGKAHAYALDLSGFALNADRWHDETANSATIVSTPAAASGWGDVHTLTFTPPSTGDYWIVVSMEMVADGTAASADEFAARLAVGGTAIAGTYVYQDVAGRADTVYGYATSTVQALTTSSTDITIQVNGTNTNGNIGCRRMRIHVIRVGAIDAGDVQEINDTGATVTGAGQTDFAAGTVGNGSDDYLLITRANKQASFWTQTHMLSGGVETPTNGFGTGLAAFGTTATSDMCQEWGLTLLAAPAAATAVGIRGDKTGGGGLSTYGEDCNRADAGEVALIAVRLQSVGASGINLTPGAVGTQWTTPGVSVGSGTAEVSPTPAVVQWGTPAAQATVGTTGAGAAAVVGQWQTPLAAVGLGAAPINLAPAAAGAQWATPPAGVSVGAVSASPATSSAQWATGAPVLALGGVELAPSTEGAQWATPTAETSTGNGVFAPASAAHWTTPAPAVVLGEVSVQASAVVAQWVTPAPGVLGGDVDSVEHPLRLRVGESEVFGLRVGGED